MHLADGILSNPALLVAANGLGAGAVVYALHRAKVQRRQAQRAPHGAAWVGTLAAFVLAAQAINVPMVPGASAHALGTGLVAFCLAPWLAVLTLFGVLVIQALLFADGGLTVLFINTLTIAVIPVCVAASVRYVAGTKHLPGAAWVGTALGNTLGAVVLAALLVGGAGAPAAWTFAWLVGVQALAGLIEGGLTASALRYLARRAPHYLHEGLGSTELAPGRSGVPWRPVVALAVVALLIPFASTAPDALEVVVARLGGR